jgi:hypothetical protein
MRLTTGHVLSVRLHYNRQHSSMSIQVCWWLDFLEDRKGMSTLCSRNRKYGMHVDGLKYLPSTSTPHDGNIAPPSFTDDDPVGR